jgi:transposase
MPKSHRPYPLEYRERIIELVRKGRTPEALAREFEPSAQCIRKWVRQADRDMGRRHDGLTTDDHAELQRLRRENARLREEREILKKAARTPAEARTAVFDFIEGWYNPTRRHSSLDYVSPVAFEQQAASSAAAPSRPEAAA